MYPPLPTILIGDIHISPSAVLWSIGAVVVGLICGFVLGLSAAKFLEPRRVKREKARLLNCLTQILKSTEQLNADVDTHNDRLATVHQSVADIQAEGDLNRIQNKLVDEIREIVAANRRLENDLTISQSELNERARELDRTRNEARIDKLSGVSNRRAFDEGLAYFHSKFLSRREPYGILLTDIDHFKRINDAYGHSAGDVVIQRIGAILEQCVRTNDVVCRYGGDEFAILLKGGNETGCQIIASRIRATVAKSNFDFGEVGAKTSVTISVGAACVMPDDTKEMVLDRADRALYRSKELGRNLVHIWDKTNNLVNLTRAEASA
jgi:diguanylate cyclase